MKNHHLNLDRTGFRSDSSSFGNSDALGFGWWLGVLAEDGRDLFFDPLDWFAECLILGPMASVEPIEEFIELDQYPTGVLPAISEASRRTVTADPRSAQSSIRGIGDRTFELVIGPNGADPQSLTFVRDRVHVGTLYIIYVIGTKRG